MSRLGWAWLPYENALVGKKGLLKVGAISSYSERLACSVSMFGRDLFGGNSFDICPIFFNLALYYKVKTVLPYKGPTFCI